MSPARKQLHSRAEMVVVRLALSSSPIASQRRLLRIPASLVRGGTSKCVIFRAEDLAELGVGLNDLLLSAFGSIDESQVDGIGGATSTTSKAAIVAPSSRSDVDVEFLFAQVGIGKEVVEYGSNCGNCATAVGLYALQNGLVTPRVGTTMVRMLNVNTGARLTATIDTEDAVAPGFGEAVVPGSASRTGVPVRLSFVDPVGSTCGQLLPSGHAVELVGPVEATLIDAGAPAMLVNARSLDVNPFQNGLHEVASELVLLRRQGAVRMGLMPPGDAIPKVGLVAPPIRYTTTSGHSVEPHCYDLSVRMMSMFTPHPAIGLTSAVALAAAMITPGTLASSLASHLTGRSHRRVRLGTAAGVVEMNTRVDGAGVLREVIFHRVARHIASMELFVPCDVRRAS
ncbi:PrpF domain-containing protein [Lentzea sp. NPDC004782]|uniref:PrpF domain-containing protein n=1 Tax=Lentzea sp. NPDC004782 TaxID=3154458 RepID=UPI0033B95BCE